MQPDKYRILIIDDDANLRKSLTDILRVKGYETLAAENGTAGLALLQEQAVNLVLVDLGLPDISGLEVLNRVKEECSAVEVIILTGNATLDSAIEATNRGAFSYLLKPYDIDQLLLHARRAIEKQQAELKIVRHSAELRRINAELKALYEVSCAISRTIEMDRLLADVLHALADSEIFSFEIRGTISLLQGERLRLAFYRSLSASELEPCRDIGLGECLCGLVAATGNAVVSGNSLNDQRHTRCISAAAPHGHVVVPLKAANTVVGVLNLYIGAETTVNEEMLNLLTTIGNQVGIAVNNARLYEETRSHSLHDPLTGLANRRFLAIQLEKCFETAKRYGEDISVIMVDIDHFKDYNDTHGHPEGDRLLVKIAETLLREMRGSDHVFRYGGEEFLFVLPRTELALACIAAERVRKAVAADTGVSVSLGVASCQGGEGEKENLLGRADEALYLAKRRGRNRVEASGRDEPRAEGLRFDSSPAFN